MASQNARLSKFGDDFKQRQGEMTNKIDTMLKATTDRIARALPSDTVKNPKLNVNSTALVLSACSYPTEDPSCSTHIHGSINTIMIHPKQQSNSHDDKLEENEEEEKSSREDNTNPSIMRRRLDPRENSDRGVSNFTGRIKGMHVFVGNFTYVTDFMIVEDISSIIDPKLSQVVLAKPFIEISNMTHDLPEGVVRFTNGTDEIAYKMPHKIEQYNSLSDLEKEHTKSVYLRNKEDKRRGVEYAMSKILGFYKECLELGLEYMTGMDGEGEVT
ncbi:hypothetical protein Tco_1348353 [Tanacetum coccineum]